MYLYVYVYTYIFILIFLYIYNLKRVQTGGGGGNCPLLAKRESTPPRAYALKQKQFSLTFNLNKPRANRLGTPQVHIPLIEPRLKVRDSIEYEASGVTRSGLVKLSQTSISLTISQLPHSSSIKKTRKKIIFLGVTCRSILSAVKVESYNLVLILTSRGMNSK